MSAVGGVAARLNAPRPALVETTGGGEPRLVNRELVTVVREEWRVVDRCVQILGGQGVTGESVVMRIFTDMRAFRIYDGPSEVHRWSMAKKIVSGADGRR